MNPIRRYTVYLVVFGVMLLSGANKAHSEVTIEDVLITDVTPSGFSVILQNSEPAVGKVSIFSDSAGLDEITTEFEMISYPLQGGNPQAMDEYQSDLDKEAIREEASLLGLTKISVHGCTPNTAYYIKVHSEAGGNVATWPEGDPEEVITAGENSFISGSRQLLINLIDDQGAVDAPGWIITAVGDGTLSPISAMFGDGAGTDQAFLNLSHFFGTDGTNWEPNGIENILLTIWGHESGPIEYILSLEFNNQFSVSTMDEIVVNLAEPQDSDGDGLPNGLENRGGSCTDVFDADTDDDGIPDGVEDANQNGVVDPSETDPCDADTDSDGVQDGTELGYIVPVPDPDGDGPLLGTDTDVFIPDEDPTTTTDPLNEDSDEDLIPDGTEDANGNGDVDTNESDPTQDDAFEDADGDDFVNLREHLGDSDLGNSEEIPENTTVFVDDDNSSGLEKGTQDHPFKTIQKGVDYAGPGDTVSVLAGNYPENINIEKSIYFIGEGPQATVVDGSNESEPVIYCSGIEDATIEGFKLQNGTGAGIRSDQSTLWIGKVIISETTNGHGIEADDASSITVYNSVINDNDLDGINSQGAHTEIVNNTIVSNGGDGIDCSTDGVVIVKNNIIVNSGGFGISCNVQADSKITFNNLNNNTGGDFSPGLSEGEGNIYAAAMFMDTGDQDFRLTADSLAIDAGTSLWAPEFDIQGQCRYDDPETVNTGAGKYDFFDMGAYEYIGSLNADLDRNGIFDAEDSNLFASQFGSANCPGCEGDLDGDEDVDGIDRSLLFPEGAKFRCPSSPCNGDLDWDLDVDGVDLDIFSNDYNRTDCDQGEPCEGDFDQNYSVEWSDLQVFIVDYGREDCPPFSR